MSGDKPQDPAIRFGGQWRPAHEVWKKMETANVVADAIERFNQRFPTLSTAETREIVPLVRQRLKNIELRMSSEESGKVDLARIAADLLSDHPPEEVIAILRQQHDSEIDILRLIRLAGEQPYVDALLREARDDESRPILPKQMAKRWNDAGRPPPGGGLWTAKKIHALLNRRR